MHSYTVEFRIFSEEDEFDVDAISKHLGITANNTRKRGEPKSSTRVFAESMWGYSVYPENSYEDWDSLEEGLESLLNIFLPLKDKFSEYLTRYQVVIWCGHFTSSFDGGPTFSPETLQKLGELGVELFLDTYCSIEENTPNEP